MAYINTAPEYYQYLLVVIFIPNRLQYYMNCYCAWYWNAVYIIIYSVAHPGTFAVAKLGSVLFELTAPLELLQKFLKGFRVFNVVTLSFKLWLFELSNILSFSV